MSFKYTDEELLAEIKRLAELLGRPPKAKEMNEKGGHSHAIYYTRFDSWNDALRRAGYDPNQRSKISREDLIEELERLAEEISRSPRQKDMIERGEFHPEPYKREFGTWNKALIAVGLDLNIMYERPPSDVLISYLQDLGDELGRTPMKKDMTELGEYGANTYIREFGSWNGALVEAGFDINIQHSVERDELLAEMSRLASELGRAPTRVEMDELGQYSHFPYEDKFGSWNEAIREVGLDVNHDPYKEAEWRQKRYGPGWTKTKKKMVRERDGFVCQDPRCEVTQEQHLEVYGTSLNVHHIQPPEQFTEKSAANEPENLISLCCVCHNKWEQMSPLRPAVAE